MALEPNTGDPIQYLDEDVAKRNEDMMSSTGEADASTQDSEATTSEQGGSILPENQPSDDSGLSVQNFGLDPVTQDFLKQQAIQNQAAAEPGAMGSDILFPGATPVRQVGTVSNKYGSAAIIGGGAGPFPVGAVLARKKALAQAAAAKAKQRAEEVLKSDVKDFKVAKAFQPAMSQTVKDTIKEYQQRAYSVAGEDWKTLLNNPGTEIGREFQMTMKGLNDLVQRGDKIATLIEEMKDKEAEGFVYSDFAQQLRDDYLSLSDNLMREDGTPDPKKLAELERVSDQLTGFEGLDSIIDRTGMDKIAGTIVNRGGYKDLGDMMMSWKKGEKKFDEQVEGLVNQMSKEFGSLRQLVRSGMISKEEVKEYMKNRLGSEYEYVETAKYAPESRSGRLSEDDVSLINDQTKTTAKFVSYDEEGNPESDFDVDFSEGDNFPTSNKKVNLTGTNILTGSEGQKQALTGNNKVQFIKTGAVPSYLVYPEVSKTTSKEKSGTVPVIISNIEKQVPVSKEIVDEYGDGTGKYETSYEKKIIEAPVIVDENVISTLLANPSAFGMTDGAAKKVAEDLRSKLDKVEESRKKSKKGELD